MPAFWNNMYSLVKNTKYSFRKQSRNRLRVDVLLTSCSPGRNRAKHRDSREIKTKTSFTRFGTNSSTDCSTFCMSPWKFLHSFSIGMAFLNDSPGLHWTNHVTLSPDCDNSEFTQHDDRKRRTAKCVCVTNVTGLLLVCVVVIFTKFRCFGVFFNKICVKEDGWSFRQPFFKQNYCHARFAVFLALLSCCVSSLILKWLQQ